MRSGPFSAIGRRTAGLAMVFAAVFAASLVAPAAAQYVTYYHAFGDWAVICARDEPTGRTGCQLGAPPPNLADGAGEVRVEIVEPPAGETSVALHVNPVADDSRQVSLTVDGGSPQEAVLSHVGEAAWRGQAARAILDEMMKGRVLSIRFVRPGGRHAEHRFALEGFRSAEKAYFQRIGAADGRR